MQAILRIKHPPIPPSFYLLDPSLMLNLPQLANNRQFSLQSSCVMAIPKRPPLYKQPIPFLQKVIPQKSSSILIKQATQASSKLNTSSHFSSGTSHSHHPTSLQKLYSILRRKMAFDFAECARSTRALQTQGPTAVRHWRCSNANKLTTSIAPRNSRLVSGAQAAFYAVAGILHDSSVR